MSIPSKTTRVFVFPILLFIVALFAFTKKYTADTCLLHTGETAFNLSTAAFHQPPSEAKYDSIFRSHPAFISQTFDYPVGKPDAKNYYKAREFGQKKHLGEDWNGIGGGNTDLGDPVYAISNGYVTFAENVCCGWGNIVRVVHHFPSHLTYPYVESFYAHLDEIHVQPGDLIQRGEQLGTIGTANGKYSAHLHLELRSFIDMGIGPGYSDDTFGFLVPTKFIEEN